MNFPVEDRGKIMVSTMNCINVYSSENGYDFVIMPCSEILWDDDVLKIKYIVEKSYNEWLESDTSISFSDYIEAELRKREIDYEIYFKKGMDQ